MNGILVPARSTPQPSRRVDLQVVRELREGRARIREQAEQPGRQHGRAARHEALRDELAARHGTAMVVVPLRRVGMPELAFDFDQHGRTSVLNSNRVLTEPTSAPLPMAAAHTAFRDRLRPRRHPSRGTMFSRPGRPAWPACTSVVELGLHERRRSGARAGWRAELRHAEHAIEQRIEQRSSSGRTGHAAAVPAVKLKPGNIDAREIGLATMSRPARCSTRSRAARSRPDATTGTPRSMSMAGSDCRTSVVRRLHTPDRSGSRP